MNAIQRKIENGSDQSCLPRGLMFLPFKTFGKFQTIYHQGEVANRLYMVKTGAVKLTEVSEGGDQLIQSIKTEGEIFGELKSIYNPKQKYSHAAVTLSSDTEIHQLSLSGIGVEQAQNAIADISELVFCEAERIKLRHQRLLNFDAAYRVREAIKDLAIRAGQRFGDETLLKIWLSHEDLSMLADSSRQTVTKVMNELKNSGKIIYSRDRILFRNLTNIHL